MRNTFTRSAVAVLAAATLFAVLGAKAPKKDEPAKEDIVDISHDNPVYDPRNFGNGIKYHKLPTISKIPPTDTVRIELDGRSFPHACYRGLLNTCLLRPSSYTLRVSRGAC